jgi:hypothetical protein
LPVKTHRLQILKASHFLNANGFYDYELVYWNDYDFYMPMNLSPEQVARILVDKLAHQCLQIPNPMEIEAADWESKIQGIWQEIRGRQFAQAS